MKGIEEARHIIEKTYKDKTIRWIAKIDNDYVFCLLSKDSDVEIEPDPFYYVNEKTGQHGGYPFGKHLDKWAKAIQNPLWKAK